MLLKSLIWKFCKRPAKFILAYSGIFFKIRTIEMKLAFIDSVLFTQINSEGLIKFHGYLEKVMGTKGNLVRVGSRHDGGYVILDSFSEVGVCISLGIGANMDFESELLSRNIPILAVDGTIQKLPCTPRKSIRWLDKNVGGKDSGSQISLNSVFEQSFKYFGWDGDCILKIDIEGSEYEVLKTFDAGHQIRASQIVLELHNLIFKLYHSPTEVLELMDQLLKTHDLVHIHGNNYEYSITIQGLTLPNVLELTFVRKEFSKSLEKEIILPNPLDAPNNKFLREIDLL